eukprot:762635-Hanusia_phi.AAC.1
MPVRTSNKPPVINTRTSSRYGEYFSDTVCSLASLTLRGGKADDEPESRRKEKEVVEEEDGNIG